MRENLAAFVLSHQASLAYDISDSDDINNVFIYVYAINSYAVVVL